MKELPRGAVLQRDKTTYAIIPRLKGGLIDVEVLRKIANVAEKYKIPVLKITGAQRIALVGIKAGDVEPIWQELGMEPAPAVGRVVRSVKVCPGTAACKLAQQDALGLGLKLDEKFLGMELPAKFKIGISGCPNNCAESWIKDFGVFGRNNGYSVVVGGNIGNNPRLAKNLAEGLNEDEVFALAEKIINIYKEKANQKERFGSFIDRVGLEEFKKMVSL